jgi:hypothetical protein
MANKFVAFLDKVASGAKGVGKFIAEKALPLAVEGAELVEPVVDLAFPAIGPEFIIVVSAVAQTEASWAVVGQAAQAKIATYAQAVVTILNTFPVVTQPVVTQTA